MLLSIESILQRFRGCWEYWLPVLCFSIPPALYWYHTLKKINPIFCHFYKQVLFQRNSGKGLWDNISEVPLRNQIISLFHFTSSILIVSSTGTIVHSDLPITGFNYNQVTSSKKSFSDLKQPPSNFPIPATLFP